MVGGPRRRFEKWATGATHADCNARALPCPDAAGGSKGRASAGKETQLEGRGGRVASVGVCGIAGGCACAQEDARGHQRPGQRSALCVRRAALSRRGQHHQVIRRHAAQHVLLSRTPHCTRGEHRTRAVQRVQHNAPYMMFPERRRHILRHACGSSPWSQKPRTHPPPPLPIPDTTVHACMMPCVCPPHPPSSVLRGIRASGSPAGPTPRPTRPSPRWPAAPRAAC